MKDFQVSTFSNFFLVGIDHRNADVGIREKFSLSEQQTSHLMFDYKKLGGDGMMVLSTCNRTEIYAFGNCPRDIISLFCKHTSNKEEFYYRYQQIKQNREAIEHLFKVGSGLESKILGDFEIVGQLKKSFIFAKEQGFSNSFMERLVNNAVQTSKKVKNNTQLSSGAASVAFASVQRIKKYIKEENAAPKVVLLGLGKIGRTSCENLINQTGIKDITLTNRTDEKAERLAQRFGVKHLDFSHLKSGLDDADVVIVATGADKPTVLPEHFITDKKRLVLDLSVPRNVHTEVYQKASFEVVDVDQLSQIAEENTQKRRDEIPAALEIIKEMTSEFYIWLESRRVAPTIQAVRQKMEAWKSKEVQNILKKYPDLNAEHAEILASQLLNKITGQFARQLKSGQDTPNDLRAIHHIFELSEHNVA
jgi:glutamyl-tRNA reductase